MRLEVSVTVVLGDTWCAAVVHSPLLDAEVNHASGSRQTDSHEFLVSMAFWRVSHYPPGVCVNAFSRVNGSIA